MNEPGNRRFGPRQAVWLLVGIAAVVLAVPIVAGSVIEWAARRQMARFQARADGVFATELFRDATPSYQPLLDSARLRRSEVRAAPLTLFVVLPKAAAEIGTAMGRHERKPGLGAWGMRRDIELTLLMVDISDAADKASRLGAHFYYLGDSVRAKPWFRLSYGLARMTGDLQSAGLALEWLAALYPYDTLGQDSAIVCLGRACEFYSRARSWDRLVTAQGIIGSRRYWTRDFAGALQWYLAALETCDAWGVESGDVLVDIGLLRDAVGEAEFGRVLRATADDERGQSILEWLNSDQTAGQMEAGR